MTAPIAWRDDALELLDQTLLPGEERVLRCTTPEEVADAIRRLVVRGAPAIGVAAAYGVALGGRERLGPVVELLGATRPTAVNQQWALERMQAAPGSLLDEAHAILADQVDRDAALCSFGAGLVGDGERLLTHCNSGPLATGGRGTAGGVIEEAWRQGRVVSVWVDETRPLLQGARLTAWELGRAGVPFRIVTDASVGTLMARGLVDRVFVGADRIAANGDVANKVGTYTVAVLAERHGVPFHVVAPLSTVDLTCASGDDIVIEERAAGEVVSFGGARVAPAHADAANFAFDVTPASLVASIVTEAGVVAPEGVAGVAGR
jgi:methylthioribose-1-phosphate isomerase